MPLTVKVVVLEDGARRDPTRNGALQATVESAIELLGSCGFNFVFELSRRVQAEPGRDGVYSWDQLEAILTGEKRRLDAMFVVGVLDSVIENNWFSHAPGGKGVAWITLRNWDFYSDAPAHCGLAYQLVQNLLIMLMVRNAQEELLLLNEVVHEPARGCISDMCTYKPDINTGIHSGKICPDCSRIIEARLGHERLTEFKTVLAQITRHASSREGPTSVSDFPWLLKMQEDAKDFAAKDIRRLADEEMLLKMRIEKLRQAAQLPAHDSPSMDVQYCLLQPGFAESDGQFGHLTRDVESRFPFPIAYCYRSLRVEYRAHERWQAMYELYRLIARYLVFVLLADRPDSSGQSASRLRDRIRNLKFGSDGDWGVTCVELLKNLSQSATQKTVLASLQASFDSDTLSVFEQASRKLVQTRNRLAEGHGFRGDRQQYQQLFEDHLPSIERMLEFMAPLAEYVLMRPVEIVDHVDGKCIYHSKILMGSDAQFVTSLLRSDGPPETVCQLLVPGIQRPLTLHPWLHLDRCDSCRREMVFLYDAVHGQHADRCVVLREYPSNHEQRRADLTEKVDRALSF